MYYLIALGLFTLLMIYLWTDSKKSEFLDDQEDDEEEPYCKEEIRQD